MKRIKDKIKRRFPKIYGYLRCIKSFYMKIKYFYIIGSWNLLIGKKAGALDFWGRCREVCADPNNQYIPRTKDAGKIINGNLIMHNGLKVKMGEFTYEGVVLTENKGAHEPQEERVFREVLRYVPRNATIIELGSYWAYYSMWFKREIKDANCYLIEPDEKKLNCGKENFKLNDMEGTFIKGKIGKDNIKIDDFIKEKRIDVVHILHSDIQGAELDMLHSCKQSILKNKIWYFFISTHSQKLHYDCLSFLIGHGFVIIASADFDFGTYCYDGILVAKSSKIKGVDPIEVPLRRANRPIHTVSGPLEVLSPRR